VEGAPALTARSPEDTLARPPREARPTVEAHAQPVFRSLSHRKGIRDRQPGEVSAVREIDTAIRKEGYEFDSPEGPTLRKQLRSLIKEARGGDDASRKITGM
jgi:hypothetical protein